jgi:5-methylcytosine-specific restriction protein A
MRNPKWHRDEIILALDLYFKLDKGMIHSRNPKIISLSETLNKLPIFSNKLEMEKFRNPNGVSLKLSNFLAIETNYVEGMNSHSKLDKTIFFEFNNDKKLLERIANSIKLAIEDEVLNQTLNLVNDDFDDEVISVKEGSVLYRLHKYRERNKSIVSKKKASSLKKNGNIACEHCGFDFEKTYGKVGRGFIECHHKVALSELDVNRETSLDDLMLVCANCHRMLHRGLELIP